MTTHGPFGFATATTDGSDEFLWTNTQPGPPSQDADTLPATTGNLQWWWNDDDTGSTGVGPESGQEGDPEGYVHPETSDTGTGFNDTYDMEFDTTLDASAEQWQFNFYTSQRGDDNDMLCEVQINESGGGWNTVANGTFGGSGDPTKEATNTTPSLWTSRSVDLSESGANTDSSTRVRILLTMPAAGTTWHNDYGIDTIEIVGTPLLEREQDSFRVYEDGTESGAVAIAAQNVDINRVRNKVTHMRVGMQTIGDAPTESAELQYKETSDGAAEWRKVP